MKNCAAQPMLLSVRKLQGGSSAESILRPDPYAFAANADWVLGAGGVAWIEGDDPTIDKRPLRSIKAPGTAYKNARMLGDDRQVDHYEKLADPKSQGNVHINSGISNKAFFEAAIRTDTDVAIQIWVKALPELPANVTFPRLANATIEMASKSFGVEVAKKLQEAWSSVGLPTKNSKHLARQ